ncbi:nuclear transport factor 2 family protein [Altererythrobacter sp.]|uniref:nuclear transport factor 2 family protein n=1 Tax=Altererythrobacter sp. TaxID=1872480 RepID=UPI003D0B540B
MRIATPIMAALALGACTANAQQVQSAAATCDLTPKQVVTRFMTQFYIEKDVRGAFETWVDPGYIQHNPMAKTGRDAAIAFLEPFFASNPNVRYQIKRVIADGDLVAVHAHGQFGAEDRGIAVVDILRVDGCKVMEHWDVVQPVPETSANDNGMF